MRHAPDFRGWVGDGGGGGGGEGEGIPGRGEGGGGLGGKSESEVKQGGNNSVDVLVKALGQGVSIWSPAEVEVLMRGVLR